MHIEQNKLSRAAVRLRRCGILSFACGAVCFLVKAVSPESVSADSILHEWFFLLPAGFFLLFLGVLLTIVSLCAGRAAKKSNGRNGRERSPKA